MIEDNGVGFDDLSLESAGIGLQNLKNRVKSIGGDIFIESKSGVLITIEVQL